MLALCYVSITCNNPCHFKLLDTFRMASQLISSTKTQRSNTDWNLSFLQLYSLRVEKLKCQIWLIELPLYGICESSEIFFLFIVVWLKFGYHVPLCRMLQWVVVGWQHYQGLFAGNCGFFCVSHLQSIKHIKLCSERSH